MTNMYTYTMHNWCQTYLKYKIKIVFTISVLNTLIPKMEDGMK